MPAAAAAAMRPARSKAEELLLGLGSGDAEARLQALRSIKNIVIGNRRAKASYIKLGAVQLVSELLRAPGTSDAALLVQAAAAVGSFAAADEGAQALTESGALPPLVAALCSGDPAVVEAAVRALKAVVQTSLAPTQPILAAEGALQQLVSLLGWEQSNVAESAAAVLARCCATPAQQAAVAAAGAVGPLVSLLSHPQQPKQEAALEALAALCSGNAATSAAVLSQEQVLQRLLRFLRQGSSAHTRYTACLCLTTLAQHLGSGAQHRKQELQQAILPVMVKLLGEPGISEGVPGLLCALVEESDELQRAATDADAIAKLAAFVRDIACHPKLREGALRALGTLCANKEEHRRQLVDCKVLPQIAAALWETGHPGVRAAACLCMRSLSRSTKLLRGNLGDVEVAAPLLALAGDEDIAVATQAAAALANMAVEYSAVKEQLLRQEGVARFAALAASMHHSLRLHGVWGLSSVAYMSTGEVKATIMRQLPWSGMAALLEDPEPDVREKGMLLLRNLVYNSHSDIDEVLAWSGDSLLAVARSALEHERASSQLKQHALYVVVNMASGSPAHKAAVMAAGWPAALVQQLADADDRVREAAVWALINLTWSRDGDVGAVERVRTLRALGAEERLHQLAERDTSLQVKERAATAVEQLRAAAEEGAGETQAELY